MPTTCRPAWRERGRVSVSACRRCRNDVRSEDRVRHLEISHFLDCIERDEDSFVDIADAVNTHEVCLALDLSAANGGATIDLPLEE